MIEIRPHAMKADIFPLGESAVTVRFGTDMDIEVNKKLRAFAERIEMEPFSGFIECTPAFAAVTVFYDAFTVHKTYNEMPYPFVERYLNKLLSETANHAAAESKTVHIPVCYGGECGPDVAFVAKHNGLTEEEVIRIHTAGTYPVYMIGFAPGFPYLGGLSEQIHTPRHSSPRTSIPAGSVGIAGSQTGVYPISTPGGWQIIGRTPLRLFRPEAEAPSLLSAGDVVKFVPITETEYKQYEEGAK